MGGNRGKDQPQRTKENNGGNKVEKVIKAEAAKEQTTRKEK